MADNVTLPGTGGIVATDEITGTGEHVQLFKLAIAADGSRTLIPADANGLHTRNRQVSVYGGGSQTGTSDQAIMAAGGSGVYNHLCFVSLYNSSATNTYANIKDGSTVRAVIPVPAYSGAVFQPAHPLRGSDNTAWNVASGASVTTAYYYGGGYTSA